MENQHRPITTVTAIMGSVFIMGMGSALQNTALAMRAGLEGFPEGLIGLIMAAYYAGLVVGSFLAAAVIRSVGYVRSFAAFASIASATAFTHVLIINPYVWIALRLLHGTCLSVMLVVVESWLNVSSTTYNRGRILSIYSVVYLASMGIGQPLVGLFSPSGFELFGITTIIISLCLVPVTLAKVTGEPKVRREPPRLLQTMMKAPLAGTGVAVSGFLFGASWSLVPRYGQQLELTDAAIGILMLLVSLGTLAFQWPLGWISDRRDRRRAILLSADVGAGSALFVAIFQPSGPLLYAAVLLFGGFAMPLYSLTIALMNDRLNPEEMIQAAGALIIYYGIGSALGPIVGGLGMSFLGPRGLFAVMAALLLLYILFARVRVRIAPKVQRRAKSRFRLYPRTTVTAFSLLRRVRPRRRKANIGQK